jgi:D-aspartate ligase
MHKDGGAFASVERWLGQLDDKYALAVVMGASVNGLSWVRSLGRHGVPVLLIDGEPLIGRYSRYAKSVEIARDTNETERVLAFLDAVRARLHAPGLLFSTSDHYCSMLTENAEHLEQGYRFLLPTASTMRSIVDKSLQYRIAQEAGIDIPVTFFPESVADLDAIGSRLSYPAILKPCTPDSRPAEMRNKSIKVMVANSPKELREGFARAADLGIRMMVQEIVPGGDDAIWGYWGFWDADSVERAWVTRRKLRQIPPMFGDGCCQVTLDAPEVLELSRRLLRAFDYRGFSGVEFKLDPRDGKYRLMEINPRTEAGNQMAITAGVDFPWIGYQYLTQQDGGAPVDFGGPFRRGVQYVNEEGDLKAFLAMRQTGDITASTWLRSFSASRSYALGAWDDPMPLLVMAGRIARAAARRGAGRA